MCKNVDVVFRHDSGGANVLAALVVKQGVDRDSCIFAMTQFLPFFFLCLAFLVLVSLYVSYTFLYVLFFHSIYIYCYGSEKKKRGNG